MTRTQQGVATAVALIAVVVTVSGEARTVSNAASPILLAGFVLLVLAALVATIGLTMANRTRLVDPHELMDVIDAGWAEDDEPRSRYNVIAEQVKQMKELASVCRALRRWHLTALWIQWAGLGLAVTGGALSVL